MKIKRSNSSYLLIVGIIGLMIGGSWLVYSIFSATFKSQIEERQAKNILPIGGNLNTEVAFNLKTRRSFSVEELSEIVSLNYEIDTKKNKNVNDVEIENDNIASDEADIVPVNVEIAL